MANYIAHYTKKQQALRRQEEALRRLVARGEGEQKLIRAAEEVRAARVRALQARLATIPPADEPAATLAAKLAAQMEVLRATPAEAILEEFGVRLTRCCTWDHGEAAMMGRMTLREVREALAAAKAREGDAAATSPTVEELESLARLLEREADAEAPAAEPPVEGTAKP